jgi:hypothetical protein
MLRIISVIILSFLCLQACRNPEIGLNYEHYMDKRDFPLYQGGQDITICHGFGCRIKSTATLSSYDEQLIKQTYGGTKSSPKQERQAIARTIGKMEDIIGKQTGTDTDQAGTYNNSGNDQFDCVDESINTTNYMRYLDMQGLLKHHKVRKPISRTFFTSGKLGPHQTATVMEIETTEIYAIDSWFRDNGNKAEVIDITTWKNGYTPDPSVK